VRYIIIFMKCVNSKKCCYVAMDHRSWILTCTGIKAALALFVLVSGYVC